MNYLDEIRLRLTQALIPSRRSALALSWVLIALSPYPTTATAKTLEIHAKQPLDLDRLTPGDRAAQIVRADTALASQHYAKTITILGDDPFSNEMMAAWRERREDRGGEEHPDEPGEGFESLSADAEELSDLPEPPLCDEDLRSSELTPQEENYPCSGSESVGNLIYRTVCNMDPYKSEAISLPFERAADCFGLEAIRGSGITFEIVEESTGTSVFNTADGNWTQDVFIHAAGLGSRQLLQRVPISPSSD